MVSTTYLEKCIIVTFLLLKILIGKTIVCNCERSDRKIAAIRDDSSRVPVT